MPRRLKPVVVHRQSSAIVGLLYFKTKTHVVLLNHLNQRAQLGRLAAQRRRHVEPEADIVVIPRADITELEVLEDR